MRRNLATVLMFVIVFCGNPTAAAADRLEVATARPDIVGISTIKGQKVPVYSLGEVYSDAPTVDQFAVEVGVELRAYSRQTGFEGCAVICRAQDSGRWGARLITVEARSFCPVTTLCPSGMKEVGRDIHSHPHFSRFRPNDIDRILLKGQYITTDLFSAPDGFTALDFQLKSGYVAGKTSLLFQDGRLKVSKIWKLADGVNFSPGHIVTRTPTFMKALALHTDPTSVEAASGL